MPDFLRVKQSGKSPVSWLYSAFDVIAYEALYLLSPARRHLFFNSGYLPIDKGFVDAEEFRAEAHSAMMYHFVARTLVQDIMPSPRKILDVGCGQGGGVRYLAQLYPSASITGTDRSAGAVLRARRQLRDQQNVRIVKTPVLGSGLVGTGNDLIVGIGTPTYVGLSRFVTESQRHLAPGGVVSVMGGYRHGDHARIRDELADAAARVGMVLYDYRDILANTFAALTADIPRREQALARVPAPFRGLARRWTDMPGSREYLEYQNGLRADFAAVLHLPELSSASPSDGGPKTLAQ